MVNLKAILWLGGRRSQEQPQPVLPHRGGGRRKKPAAAGETRQWERPTQGTTPADRKRISNRIRNRRRLTNNPRP